MVLGPALDGGYTLIGLSKAHARIFADIPWSTPEVYGRTVERAREMRLPVVNVPQWYDIDDEDSLRLPNRVADAGPPPPPAPLPWGPAARETPFFRPPPAKKKKTSAWTT